jgi:DNA polymerase (family X)
VAGGCFQLIGGRLQPGLVAAESDREIGADMLETMAEATPSREYQYFGVAVHSKSAHYSGGLSAEEVAEQRAEADRLTRNYRSR